MLKQRTLKDSFTVKGKGLHTGLEIELTLKPAPDNFGRVIKRVDLEGQPEIPALADYVSGTTRGTVIKKGDIQISTVEHALAALYALGIDNCLMEVNAPEFPILDGSAKFYVEKINEVGVQEQQAEKDFFVVTKKITYQMPDSKSTITILPDDDFSVQVLIGYDSPILSNQFAVLDSMDDFEREVAPCRTFVFVREIEPLLKMNLIKGGDLNNALVIYDKEIPQSELQRLADTMHQPCPKANKFGYLNTELLFDNEPARHKMLDVIGDLSLIGKPIKGRVIASYPGHTTNTALAKQIRHDIKRLEVFPPKYSIYQDSIMDVNDIRKLLPHRFPFLLVDKVMEITESTIVTVKNVSFNEIQFLGHFPEEPVMPGVLQVEAMAQSAGILVLKGKENPELYSTYLLKIDNVRFYHKVVPGDTMIMRVNITTEIRHGIATMKGYTFIKGELACEAEITAQIVKNK